MERTYLMIRLIFLYSPYLDDQAIIMVKQSEERVQHLAAEFTNTIYFFAELSTDIRVPGSTIPSYWFYDEDGGIRPRIINPDLLEREIAQLAEAAPDTIHFIHEDHPIDILMPGEV
jgi:hypothetical protein